MNATLFKNNIPAQGTMLSPEQKILEELTILCQKLDDYLNSSPSEPACFLTRKVIAEAAEHSPMFSMAQSLPADPLAIKNNIQKVVNPLLRCLRRFIDVYGRPNSNLTSFNSALVELHNLIQGAYSYVAHT